MMAKITKGRDHAGAVRYVMQEKKNAQLIDSKDVLTSDKQSIISSFSLQCRLNPNVSVVVGHISLDFSAEDAGRITNDLMVRIAREYMDLMNIRNTQYILARHYDREHPHCHLVFNRVNNSGKVISDRNDRLRSTRICRELTEKYGLHIAAGKEHVKRERLKEPDSTKYLIYDALVKSIPQCRNWDDLRAVLSRDGINMSFVFRGSTTDIQGVVFGMNGFRFNGSKIDRRFSYSKLSDLFLRDKRQMTGTPPMEEPASAPKHIYTEPDERRPSYPPAEGRTVLEDVKTEPHTSVSPGTVSSVVGDTASVLTSVGSDIISGVSNVMVEALSTPSAVSSSGGGGGSSSEDLDDDEYIDEYGIRRKRRHGRHR